MSYEKLNNLRCSPYRYINYETNTEGEDVTYFYAPRALVKTDYDDNIEVDYDGIYTLPVLAYRAYKSLFGEDAVRLYWIILEFSQIKELRDVEIGTKLIFPSINTVREIIK